MTLQNKDNVIFIVVAMNSAHSESARATNAPRFGRRLQSHRRPLFYD